MRLYKITFKNDGGLTNPKLDSPTYVISDNKFNAMLKFLNTCNINYSENDLSPNKIKITNCTNIENVIGINEIIKNKI